MLNTGIADRLVRYRDRFVYNERSYNPSTMVMPSKLVQSKSQAWVGLERIIYDIIKFSGINANKALEFGVEFGYSTAAFANFFNQVIGVDIFTGDAHAGYYGDIYELTKQNLKDFANIQLVKSDYRDFIRNHDAHYDLIHVDIVHTYEDTHACGLWAAKHSSCTLFHDTQSYPAVKKAVSDIAKQTGKRFYNYRKCNGLGIIV